MTATEMIDQLQKLIDDGVIDPDARIVKNTNFGGQWCTTEVNGIQPGVEASFLDAGKIQNCCGVVMLTYVDKKDVEHFVKPYRPTCGRIIIS